MRRTVIALAVLAVAGCGSEPAPEKADTASKPVRFAQCMRDNGVAAFPDPDASGELSLDGVVNGSSIDADGPAWKKAIAACRDLQPSGFAGLERDVGQQDHALVFADCIREHGVKDFPDPAPGDPMVDTRKIPSSSQPGGMDILNAAMEACRGAAEKAMGERR